MTSKNLKPVMKSCPHIDYYLEDERWSTHSGLNDEYITRIVDAVLNTQTIDSDLQAELSVVFSNDEQIQVLNKDYRGKDKPTNVLSFPQDGGEVPGLLVLGDIILAYETIAREAEEQEKDFFDHLTHLIVHGVLHLLGYDHENDQEAEEMEALEVEILRILEVKNPY